MIMCYYGRFRVKLIAISMTIIFLLTNNIISISAVRIDLEIGSAVFNEMVSNGENKNNNKQPLANLDIDPEGRLLFLQIKTPRRQWEINNSLNCCPFKSAAFYYVGY